MVGKSGYIIYVNKYAFIDKKNVDYPIAALILEIDLLIDILIHFQGSSEAAFVPN